MAFSRASAAAAAAAVPGHRLRGREHAARPPERGLGCLRWCGGPLTAILLVVALFASVSASQSTTGASSDGTARTVLSSSADMPVCNCPSQTPPTSNASLLDKLLPVIKATSQNFAECVSNMQNPTIIINRTGLPSANSMLKTTIHEFSFLSSFILARLEQLATASASAEAHGMPLNVSQLRSLPELALASDVQLQGFLRLLRSVKMKSFLRTVQLLPEDARYGVCCTPLGSVPTILAEFQKGLLRPLQGVLHSQAVFDATKVRINKDLSRRLESVGRTWRPYSGSILKEGIPHACSLAFGKQFFPASKRYCEALRNTSQLLEGLAHALNSPTFDTTKKIRQDHLFMFLSELADVCTPTANNTLTAEASNNTNYMCLRRNCPTVMTNTSDVRHIDEGMKAASRLVYRLAGQLTSALSVENLTGGPAEQEDALLLAILPCGLRCSGGTFEEDEEHLSRVVIQVFSWLTLVFTTIALVSFVVNRGNLNKYPTRIFVYINACYFLFSVVVLVQVTGGAWRNYSCHADDGTMRQGEPAEAGTSDGLACSAFFMMSYFLLISSLFWWFCLTHAWYKTFKAFEDQGIKDSFARYEVIYHLVVWPLAAVLGAAVLAQRKVDGVPLYGVCFTNDNDTWFYFMSVPVIVVGAVGLPFLCLGTHMVWKFRREMRVMTRRGSIRSLDRAHRNDQGLKIFLGRMTLFIIGSFAHLLLQLAIAVYRRANFKAWVSEGEALALCQVTACDLAVCQDLKPQPNFGAFVLVIVFVDMQGIILCLWAFNRQTWQEWVAVSSRAGSRTSVLLKRLSSHMLSVGDISSVVSAAATPTADSIGTTSSLSDSRQLRELKTSENTRYNEEVGRRFQLTSEEFDRRMNPSPLTDESLLPESRKGSNASWSTGKDSSQDREIVPRPLSPDKQSDSSSGGGHTAEKRRSDFSSRGVRFSTTTPVELDLLEGGAPRQRAVSDARLGSVSSENTSPMSAVDSPLVTPSRSILKSKHRSLSQSASLTPETPRAVASNLPSEPSIGEDVFQENIAAGAGVSPVMTARGRDILRLSRPPRAAHSLAGSESSGNGGTPVEVRPSPEARRFSFNQRTVSASPVLESRPSPSLSVPNGKSRRRSGRAPIITEESESADAPPLSRLSKSPTASVTSPMYIPNGGASDCPPVITNGDGSSVGAVSWRTVEEEVSLAKQEHQKRNRLSQISHNDEQLELAPVHNRPVSLVLETNL